MAYHPNIHHRRSIRLKGYDYSQVGLYFITICVQNRDCLFGKIVDGQMILNDSGKMVEKWIFELKNKFPDIECEVFVVMPNHIHCIIENTGNGNPNIHKNPSARPVGADLRVCPNTTGEPLLGEPLLGEHMEPLLGESLGEPLLVEHMEPLLGEHIGSPLHHVIQWVKTMTTNEYIRGVKTLGWPRFDKKLWQRNYWEHIIRDQKSFETISEYIINNPKNWNTDKFKNL